MNDDRASDRYRELNDALRDELERRAHEDDADPDAVIAWDVVKERTAAHLRDKNARGKPRG